MHKSWSGNIGMLGLVALSQAGAAVTLGPINTSDIVSEHCALANPADVDTDVYERETTISDPQWVAAILADAAANGGTSPRVNMHMDNHTETRNGGVGTATTKTSFVSSCFTAGCFVVTEPTSGDFLEIRVDTATATSSRFFGDMTPQTLTTDNAGQTFNYTRLNSRLDIDFFPTLADLTQGFPVAAIEAITFRVVAGGTATALCTSGSGSGFFRAGMSLNPAIAGTSNFACWNGAGPASVVPCP
jgi:hypothetical protein